MSLLRLLAQASSHSWAYRMFRYLPLPLHPPLPDFASDIWRASFAHGVCAVTTFLLSHALVLVGIGAFHSSFPSKYRLRNSLFVLRGIVDSVFDNTKRPIVSQSIQVTVRLSVRASMEFCMLCSAKSKSPDGGRLRVVILCDLASVLGGNSSTYTNGGAQ